MLPDILQTESPALRTAYEETRFAAERLDGKATEFARKLNDTLENIITVADTHTGTEAEVSGEGIHTARELLGRVLYVLEDHPAREHVQTALAMLKDDEAELPEWIGPDGEYMESYEALRVAVRNLSQVSPPYAYELAEATWAWYAEMAPSAADWLMGESNWSEAKAEQWLETPHTALGGESPTARWEAGGWYDVLVILEDEARGW